ncbi:ABC transporter permease [Phaeovulum sp.]|uniref:ABC transporter permease n=1 Tax=Phaeovulum sp. TaxID=2934796 RepID=UPI0039E51AB6
MSKIIYTVSASLAVLFLVLPLLIVLPLAFNDSTFLNYPMEGFTLNWFHEVLTRAPWLFALGNSFKVALGAMVLALLIGGTAAMGTMASRKATQIVLSVLFISPLVIPSVVIGVAMYYAFARIGASGTYISLILAHSILGAPLVFLSVMTGLKGLNPELDRAGASMGASRWYRFRTVTLQLTLPSFLTGALFAFITSFDEVVVALFLASPETMTLPKVLFSSLRDRLEPTIVVVALMLSVVSMVFIALMGWLQKRSAYTAKP